MASLAAIVDAWDGKAGDHQREREVRDAIEELGRTDDPAAIEPLARALRKKSPDRFSSLDRVHHEALRALLRHKQDPRAVAALTAVLERTPDEGFNASFEMQLIAVELGALGDPRAVPALILRLFPTGGADLHRLCRVSLVQIGEPAVGPLIELFEGRNAAVAALARRLDYRRNHPGIVQARAALVLGDLRPPRALPLLLAALERPPADRRDARRAAIATALGRYGDRAALPALTVLLHDRRATMTERIRAAEALNLLGDRRAVPALVRCTAAEGRQPQLRETCALAYANLAPAAELPRLRAIVREQHAAELNPAVDRLALAEECQSDVDCYGRKLAKQKPSDAELYTMVKAAFELGRLDPDQALPVVLRSLCRTESPEVNQALLLSLRRLAGKECGPCKQRLTALVDPMQGRHGCMSYSLPEELKVTLATLCR